MTILSRMDLSDNNSSFCVPGGTGNERPPIMVFGPREWPIELVAYLSTNVKAPSTYFVRCPSSLD